MKFKLSDEEIYRLSQNGVNYPWSPRDSLMLIDKIDELKWEIESLKSKLQTKNVESILELIRKTERIMTDEANKLLQKYGSPLAVAEALLDGRLSADEQRVVDQIVNSSLLEAASIRISKKNENKNGGKQILKG